MMYHIRNNTMKSIYIVIISMLAVFFTGCCGAGLQQFSDGNWYYPNWCEYDKCAPNGKGQALCWKNGEIAGVINALSNEEVRQIREYEMYMQQRQAMSLQNINNGLNQINNSVQQTTNQLNQTYSNTIQSMNNSNQRLHNYNSQYYNSNNSLQNNRSVNTTCIRNGQVVNCTSNYR